MTCINERHHTCMVIDGDGKGWSSCMATLNAVTTAAVLTDEYHIYLERVPAYEVGMAKESSTSV
jgi:hypothetical protein